MESINDFLDEQYDLARERYEMLPASSYLTQLEVGDVLMSLSGNARLVLKFSEKEGTILFLSKLSKKSIQVEHAERNKINSNKVAGIVRARYFSPLGNVRDVAENLSQETACLHNVEILLGQNPLGRVFESQVYKAQEDRDTIDVRISVDNESGKIADIGGVRSPEQETVVGVVVNSKNLPTFDYIEKVAFHSETSNLVKEQIILASIFSNTLQNAVNFHEFSKHQSM